MFSLDAMTRGQHAISTATADSRSSLSTSSSVNSLASVGTYATLEGEKLKEHGRRRGTTESPNRASSTMSERSNSRSTTTVEIDAISTVGRQLCDRAARVPYDVQSLTSPRAGADQLICLYHEELASSGTTPLRDSRRQVAESNLSPSVVLSVVEQKSREKRKRNRDDFVIRCVGKGAFDETRRREKDENGNDDDDDEYQELNLEQDNTNNRSNVATQTSIRAAVGSGKFRYVVGALIVFGVTLSAYASNTMYIAAIEMISNDVLQSGMTTLRAKHLSNDPTAVNKNAAAPGTCPVEATQFQTKMSALIQEKLLTIMNASEISAYERQAMLSDTIALHEQIDKRLASGQLVDWTISQRGYIFTAHNIGSILLAVPVGRLGLIYGASKMMLACILLSSVRMLLLPTLAGHTPFWVTFVFEILIGGIGGNIAILGYPLAAAWLLPDEANFFIALVVISGMIGIAATNFISTQLLTSAALDWCWCYYLPGILLFLLSILWFVWGADRPEHSRFVSRAELHLLQSNTIAKRNESILLAAHESNNSSASGASHRAEDEEEEEEEAKAKAKAKAEGKVEGGGNLKFLFGCEKETRRANKSEHDGERESLLCRNDDDDDDKLQQPLANNCKPRSCTCPHGQRNSCPANQMQRKPNWSTIFTCHTIWAITFVAFANHWTTKNATLLPTFLSNILHLDSGLIGIILGIKGLFALVFGSLFAFFTRKLIVKRPFNVTLTTYRRFNQALALLLYSCSIALVTLLDCDVLANFVSLLILPIVSSFNSISVDQMPLDMSAEDSGLLVSVIRLISIGDIFALPVASYILSYAPNALAGNRNTWRLVWLVGFAFRCVTSLYFIFIAESKPKSYSRLEPLGACKSSKSSATSTAAQTTGDRYSLVRR